MTPTTSPQPYAAAAAPPPQPSRRGGPRRVLALLGRLLVVVLALMLALVGGLWWWTGTDSSLARTLALAAQYLPEGQSLQSRDVSGTLRAGGRIGWLRWSGPTLAVEVHGARIAWSLAPLLQRQLRLGELHAERLHITPHDAPDPQPAPPTQPLQQLTLPLQIDLPFRVDRILWGEGGTDTQAETGDAASTDAAADTEAAAHPALTIDGLTGSYRYDGDQHRLAVDGLTLAQGHYALQATLQGAAPMALQARLDGTLRTPLPASAQPLQARVQASVQGTLATEQALLTVTGQVTGLEPTPAASGQPGQPGQPAPPSPEHASAPRADLQARIAPWASQPLLQAAAEVQSLNLAALWPQAPITQLSGSAALEPATDGAPDAPPGWRLQAALRNAQPGPWDRQHLPMDTLQARATFDGSTWHVPESLLRVGGGSIALQGSYTPATQTLTQALQGRLELQALNPAALHTQLDAAPLSGTASAESSARDGAVRFAADLRAAASRPASRRAPTTAPMLRLEQLTAQGQWQGDRITLAQLRIDALHAQINAQALHIDTAGPALQGRLQATLPGATAQFDGQLAPATGQGTLALNLADAQRTQGWLQRLARLPGLDSLGRALADWRLDGNAALTTQWRGGWHDLQRQLQAAGLTGPAQPNMPPAAQGAGRFELQAQLTVPRLQLTNTPPTRKAPGSQAPTGTKATRTQTTGKATAKTTTQAADQPQPAQSPQPAASTASAAAAPLTLALQDTTVALRGSLAQATLALDGALRHGSAPGHQAQLRLRASAGHQGAGRWQAQVDALELQARPAAQPGPWTLRLAQPLAMRLRQSPQTVLEADAGQLAISGPRPGTALLRWQPLRYAQGAPGPRGAQASTQLRTQGELQGLPLDWANAWQTTAEGEKEGTLAQLGLAGNLVLDGAWDVDIGDTLSARASLRRSSGDLRLLSGDALPGSSQAAASTSAGLRQAEVTLTAEGDSLRARLDWDSERAGRMQADGSTRLARAGGAWDWPADAPLAATVRAELPDVGVWSALAPPGWRVRGTLSADARLSGTRAAPQWSGQLAADQFSVRSLLDGVDLQDGRLRATLQGERLTITELRVHGGQGSRARIPGQSGNRTPPPQDGGELTGSGTITWGAAANPGSAGGGAIAMDMRAQARALQVLARADRQLSISGDLTAQLQDGQFTLRGQLATDRATIILPEAGAPTLDSDVVVRSAARDREAARQARQARQGTQGSVQAARAPDIALTLDLGSDFALQGHGITTRLEGQLDIRSSAATGAAPRVTGEVRTVQGRYRAWGQALDVETGLLRFNGPYDNPSLDVLAIRPNISVRAGVQVSGSAQRPRVRLFSDPELPDAEKLSWVVLGRSNAGGGAEAALLQQAALAMLGRGNNAGSLTGGLAQGMGLDEIGFKGPGSGEDASAAALTFGKRLSKDLYVSYERSLTGVLGTLYIFLDLSDRLTLRGQTGIQSAVDLIYAVRYD